MEREIQREFDDGITPYGGNLTVLEIVRKYILQKQVRGSFRYRMMFANASDAS